MNESTPLNYQIQCVCGEAFDAGPSATVRCPNCERPAPAVDAQNSIALQRTIIGDVVEDDGDLDNFPVGRNDALDHFTVLELIGAGGMGAVFRARDESLQRFVALKVIRGGNQADDRRHRLIHEARAQARVSHPNIVHIYYVGLHNNCPFFAMELVNGKSLGALASERTLAFAEIIDVAQQTTDALRHSANMGVIHGDVKPANIILQQDTVVKLSDFGLAGTAGASGVDSTQTGPAGTLNYMAPEVAAGQAADEQSDMFSLGVMLYELTFGELPEQSTSNSLQVQLEERKKVKLRIPKNWPKDRPEGWKKFLQKILQTDRNQRFSSYAELSEELDSWDAANVQPAGRFQRACSFLADMATAGIFAGLTGLVGLLPGLLSDSKEGNSGGPLLWLVLAVTVWIHVRWKKSPGKKLMQLKITDLFGLKPTDWKLVAKSVGTYMFFWIGAIIALTDKALKLTLGQGLSDTSVFETALLLAVTVLFVVNTLWLVISKRGQSAVDYFLELKVVLDTPNAVVRKPGILAASSMPAATDLDQPTS